MNDLEHFRRVAGDNLLRQWLEKERSAAVKYLTEATDAVQIHRAQGKVLFIDRQLDMLLKAKDLH